MICSFSLGDILEKPHGILHGWRSPISKQRRHSLHVVAKGDVVSNGDDGGVNLLLGGELIDSHGNLVLEHPGQHVSLQQKIQLYKWKTGINVVIAEQDLCKNQSIQSSFLISRPNWVSQYPHPQRECWNLPPLGPRGQAHLLGGRGWKDRRRDRHWYSRYTVFPIYGKNYPCTRYEPYSRFFANGLRGNRVIVWAAHCMMNTEQCLETFT